MTILAAVASYGEMWIGCDGCACAGDEIVSLNQDKWFVREDGTAAMGVAGPFAQLALIGRLNPSPMSFLGEHGTDYGFSRSLVESRVRGIRDHLISDPSFKFVEQEADPTKLCGSELLIAGWCDDQTPIVMQVFPDLISIIDAPVEEGDIHYCAVGSGAPWAMGAMHGMICDGERSARKLVRSAVESATRFSASCGGVMRFHQLLFR